MPNLEYTTPDGYNPEIIYHIMENQSQLPFKRTYNQLDKYLRQLPLTDRTVSNEAQRLQTIIDTEEQMLDRLDDLEHEAAVRGRADSSAATQSRTPSDTPGGTRGQGGGVSVGPADYTMENVDMDFGSDTSSFYEEPNDEFDPSNTEYVERLARLRTRTCLDLQEDTDEITAHDYFHGVYPLMHPEGVIRFMRTTEGKEHIFSPYTDDIRDDRFWTEGDVNMPQGKFVVQYPDPTKPGIYQQEKIALPHIYLPGWNGDRTAALRSGRAWHKGAWLAEGRYYLRTMELKDMGENRPMYLPMLSQMIVNLGFPNPVTFINFTERREIKDAFRELWDVYLKHAHSDHELPFEFSDRRSVALRVFYSRTLGGQSEYDKDAPDKSDWLAHSHMAYFSLKVEKVCRRYLLPPLAGQIPVLAGRVSSAHVAWAGVELARVLRRMQKNSRAPYLDEEGRFAAGVLADLATSNNT